MLKRTIVGLILAPILLLVVLLAPEIVTALVVSLFCAIGAYELLYGTKLVREPVLLVYTVLIALLIPLWSYFGRSHAYAVLGITIWFLLVFLELMRSGLKIPFSKAAMCVVGGIVVPYMFSALVRIECMEDGRYFIMIPFVTAFMSDIGAYFAGSFLGKHKLCPVISPKKTVEGLVGGLLSAILSMVVYGLVLAHVFDLTVDHLLVVVYGVAGSLCGVVGDLSFSVIKRQTGIKDYGDLIPGHGGILDRFDSVIVAAPMIEALLLLMPMAY